MTNEERDLITKFIARVGGGGQSGAFGGSVPQSQGALPPIDRDADALIAQLFQQYPDARYRITQTAVVQEAALAEAQNRIQRLQWELEQTQHAATQAAPQQQKGFFSSLFGGGAGQPMQRPMGGMGQGGGYGQAFQPTSPPPQPQYPPSYQPGMFQRGGGSGFLGSALTTAAGVAGGMVVGNALMGAFGGHGGGESSTSPWGANTSGGDPAGFGGAGVATDPTGGYDQQASFNDPFSGAGVDQGGGGYDTQASYDGGGGGFDVGGGGFDGGGSDNS